MAKIELFLETGLEVSAKVTPDPNTYTLGVRGWKEGKFIVLDHPSVGVNLTKVVPDAKCSIRYISGGKVTSFVTNGITVFRNPLNIFIIEYPKTVHSQISLRKQQRIKTSLPTSVRELEPKPVDSIPPSGVIMDLSLGGVLFASNKDLPINKVLSFDFEFITKQKIHQIKAKVKNKRIDWQHFDLPYLHGCEFLDMKEDERTIFKKFFEYCFKQLDNLKAAEQSKNKKTVH